MTRSLHILALDDDPTMGALYSIAFRRLPVRLLTAENEAKAQAFLEKEPLDVFLVDLHLGEADGLEIAEKILRGTGRKIPIVIVSAESNGLQRLVDDGRCVGYLLKPISITSFAADVMSYIDGSRAGVEPSFQTGSQLASVQVNGLGQAFLQKALAGAREFCSRPDATLFQDHLLAQTAHQWVGASGIDCLPDVEREARQLEQLARTQDVEHAADIRRLLSEILIKFEGSKPSASPAGTGPVLLHF